MSTITSLWMGDLEPYMDENFIIQAFMDWGEEPINVKMIRNKVTGLPQGYCFVEFRDKDQAQRCMLRLNGKNIPRTTPQKRFKLNHASYGREVGAPARPGAANPSQEYSLFVGDLSEEVDDLMLYASFKRYPSLKTAKVVIDYDGRTKGYGFVRFFEENDQQKALHEMQNVIVGRRPIRVSFAVPKNNLPRDTVKFMRQGAAGVYGSATYSYDPSAQAYANTQSYYNSSWPQQQPTQSYQSSGGQQSANVTAAASATPGYYNNYSGGSNFSNISQSSSTAAEQRQLDLETLEDPKLDIDIEAENAKYIEQSEDFYQALHECRWFGIDNAMASSNATAAVS